MNCVPVFDVREAPFHGWPFLYIGCSIMLVGGVTACLRRNESGITRWLILVLSSSFTIFATGTVWCESFIARRALSQGQVAVLDGVVRELQPVPPDVKGEERLRVSDHVFTYSDFVVGPGMNVSERIGAELAVGQHLRVWYSGDDILRIERCAASSPPN